MKIEDVLIGDLEPANLDQNILRPFSACTSSRRARNEPAAVFEPTEPYFINTIVPVNVPPAVSSR